MGNIMVQVDNTPIFEQLKAERGYNPKFPEHLTRPFSFHVDPSEHDEERSFMAPGAWMARPVPKMNEPEPVKLVVNFHPLDLVNDYPDEATFVRERVEEFGRKHPDATNIVMFTKEEADGTITLSIKGYEQPGIKMAQKPDWTAEEPKGEEFVIRGLAETLPPIFQIEHKTDPVPESLASKQLALYRGVNLMRPKSESIPEQTDESVNAASNTDVPNTQTAVRPLWFSDEDNADEE
ncbi:hypothetical protein SEA_KARDASHIAN_77 [Streptomyces phage Kardashian]|nr:hypothetical protein SEA_KARDASHIAN_77 [Streptomyces phage Kardashian]